MQNPARFIGLALEVPAYTRKLEATDASNWPDIRGRCSSAVRVEVFADCTAKVAGRRLTAMSFASAAHAVRRRLVLR